MQRLDVEDLVDAQEEDEKDEQANASTLVSCSSEVVNAGSVSECKAELYVYLNAFVRDWFAAKEVDICKEELDDITELCLEMGSVDVSAPEHRQIRDPSWIRGRSPDGMESGA